MALIDTFPFRTFAIAPFTLVVNESRSESAIEWSLKKMAPRLYPFSHSPVFAVLCVARSRAAAAADSSRGSRRFGITVAIRGLLYPRTHPRLLRRTALVRLAFSPRKEREKLENGGFCVERCRSEEWDGSWVALLDTQATGFLSCCWHEQSFAFVGRREGGEKKKLGSGFRPRYK